MPFVGSDYRIALFNLYKNLLRSGGINMDRDCKNCIYANWNGNDNGCTKWDCEYTPKDEVIKIYEKVKAENDRT